MRDDGARLSYCACGRCRRPRRRRARSRLRRDCAADGSHLVTTCIVCQLGPAEQLEQRWKVHPESTTVAPAEAVPSSNWVRFRPCPRFHGAIACWLRLVCCAEENPTILSQQPFAQVVDHPPLLGEGG